MKKISLLIIFLLGVTTIVNAESLPYRPSCVDSSTLVNTPWKVTNWTPDNTWFDLSWIPGGYNSGKHDLCYQNESLLYIKYDWANTSLGLGREYEDIYSTDIGGQSNAIKAERGFEVHFDYYFPYNGLNCYVSQTQHGYHNNYAAHYVFFNNVEYADANCGGCEDFADANYKIPLNALTSCGVWYHFNVSSLEFDNSFTEIDGVNRLVSFNVQFANAYIRNVYILYGQKLDKRYDLY